MKKAPDQCFILGAYTSYPVGICIMDDFGNLIAIGVEGIMMWEPFLMCGFVAQ